MVNTISLHVRHCFLAAILAAFFLYLSFPILDHWYFSILSYAIFSFFYVNLGQKKSAKSVKLFFLFTFLFWFLRRSIIFESIFETSTNYFQNQMHGVFFTLLLFITLAIYSAFLNSTTLILIQHVKNSYLKYVLIVLSLILTTELNDIYLPLPAEYVIFQNDYLLASLNVLHPYYYKIGFYLSTLLLAISIGKINHFSKAALIVLSWIFVSAFIGHLAINHKKKQYPNPMNIILVQSNQSVLNQLNYPIENYFEMVNNEIDSKFKREEEVYVFWPESFMEESENNISILTSFQRKSRIKQIHIIGTFVISENGIINKMVLISSDGKVSAEYFKNHLFPIGEKSIEIPLIPSSWTKANIPVLSFDKVSTLNHKDKIFLPLICYESVIDTHYNKLNSLKRDDHFNIMVNISKDSFYEKTSLIKLHSLYSRIKSSILKLPMIRVSTTEGSEVIDSTGILLARARAGQLSVTSFVVR